MAGRIPVLIVEGLSFALAATCVFPRRKAIDLGGLGHALTAGAIAKRAEPLIRIQLAKGCRVVLSVDREVRSTAATALEAAIHAALPIDCQERVAVVVADRMLENWLLADVRGLTKRSYISRSARQRQYEGTHGKNELRQLFVDHDYDETTHAPELMKHVRMKMAVKNSTSFKRFVQRVKSG